MSTGDLITDLHKISNGINNPFVFSLLFAIFFALLFWAAKNIVKFILFTIFGIELKFSIFKKNSELKNAEIKTKEN